MKRSAINQAIKDAELFFAEHRFVLPAYARWTAEEWRSKGPEADEIRSRRLGWDVTDFASGDFAKLGLTLFTLRNGRLDDPRNRKVYAEKIMLVGEGQVTPWHFHEQKTEDIINRGAGRLIVGLWNSTPAGGFSDQPVAVSMDGILREVSAGARVVLEPGDSITLVPGVYHKFYAEPGAGPALVGEVSSVNDDATDNRFLRKLPRYPSVSEDEAPYRLLCTEYPGEPYVAGNAEC